MKWNTGYMSAQHWTMDQDPDSCSGAFSGTSGHSQQPGSRGGAAFVENVDHGYYELWVDLKEDEAMSGPKGG